MLTELLAAAELDMQWHLLGADAPLQDVDKFEAAALENTIWHSAPCHRVTGRATSCTSGAMATEPDTTPTCGARCWTTTPTSGSKTMADRHAPMAIVSARMILSIGNTQDLAQAYKAWLGRDPYPAPMKSARPGTRREVERPWVR